MIDLTPILQAAILLILAILTVCVVPKIKGQIDSQEFAKAYSLVQIAVGAAEQIFSESGMGEKKKAYVLNYLESRGLTLDLETIDNMIESAVYQLTAPLLPMYHVTDK